MSDTIDIVKTWMVNSTVLAVTMADIEAILSITLLLLSIVYTIYKLINLNKDKL